MSNKTEAKIDRLPPKYEFDNFIMGLSMPILWVALLQFAVNTWRVEYAKWLKKSRGQGLFIPTPLRKIEVYNFLCGESCNTICARLVAYGIPYQRGSLDWELWPGGGGIGLRFTIWVPGPQWAMADLILAQYQGRYIVESRPSHLRGYTLGAPWGVPARPRSFDGWLINLITGGGLDAKKAALKPIKDDKGQEPNKRPRMGANGHKGKNIPGHGKRPNSGPTVAPAPRRKIARHRGP